jgi:hypothetical protein
MLLLARIGLGGKKMYKIIGTYKGNCPRCKKQSSLDIREQRTEGLIEEVLVEYIVEYSHCKNCDENWFEESREQWLKSFSNAKIARKVFNVL